MKKEIEVNLLDRIGTDDRSSTPHSINIEQIESVGTNSHYGTGTVKMTSGMIYYTKEGYHQLRDKIEEARILRECYTVKVGGNGKSIRATHYIPLETVDYIEVNSENNHITLWVKGTRIDTGMTGIELRKTIIKIPM